MHKIKNLKCGKLLLLFLFLFFSLLVLWSYDNYRKNKAQFVFLINNHSAEIDGKLWIQSKELRSDTLMTGILCVTHATDVVKVDLFMPDMGHGSSPPVVKKSDQIPKELEMGHLNSLDYGCFNISKIEMFMPGLWQVRVFYKSYEEAIFAVDIKE